jgi:hypothetical protein
VLDWWRRVTRKDSPRDRYMAQRKLGATKELALDVVAESYGLKVNIIRLGTDGSEKPAKIKWSLEQMDGLLFTQWLYATGRISEDMPDV